MTFAEKHSDFLGIEYIEWKPWQLIIAPTPLAFQISASSIQPEFSQSLLSALQTAALAGWKFCS